MEAQTVPSEIKKTPRPKSYTHEKRGAETEKGPDEMCPLQPDNDEG